MKNVELWNAFEKTGKINDYINYKNSLKNYKIEKDKIQNKNNIKSIQQKESFN
ncbi:MAG: hypothetical protein RR549_02580 [Oscillospiraceae bacterium]